MLTNPKPHPARIPLSFSQERLWFLHKMQGSLQYHMSWVFRVEGPLDKDLLEASFRDILERHQVLRTVIKEEEGAGSQQVIACSEWNIECVGEDIFSRPFDLSRDTMLRVGLAALPGGMHELYVVLHHIAFDWWSIGVLAAELGVIYRSRLAGKDPVLPDLPLQYSDYACWQRNYFSGQAMEEGLSWWENNLQHLQPLGLFTDHPRPALQSIRGGMVRANLDAYIRDRLMQLCRQENLTLFMALLGIFNVMLYRYTGQEDICVGTPVAGRKQPELEHLIGMFINTIALRSSMRGGMTGRELLRHMREVTLNAYDHQEVPFEKVVEKLRLERDTSRTPVFQAMFSLQHETGTQAIQIGDLRLFKIHVPENTSKFDLSLNVIESRAGLELMLEYCSDLYDASTAERMLHHYQNLLQALLHGLDKPLGTWDMLDSAEWNYVVKELNNSAFIYDRNISIPERFLHQAEQMPDAIAVIQGASSLTYRELSERSEQLAQYLLEHGGGPGTYTAICMDHCPEIITGMLAILRSGSAYVPVDPAYPADRITYMLDNSQSVMVLTSSKCVELVRQAKPRARIIVIDQENDMLPRQPKSPVRIDVQPSDPFYVIYTSGTTGRPKGVVLEHGNFTNFNEWFVRASGLSPAARGTLLAGVGFDVFGSEVWPFLAAGGCICIPQEHERSTIASLVDFFDANSITHSFMPTALVADFINASAGRVKWLQNLRTGGEKLSQIDVSGLHCELFNFYGPTETTVSSTVYQVTASDQNAQPPIGKPFGNNLVYILDEKLNPVPVGVGGELYVGGDGVARGYAGCPEITAERFVADPFCGKAGARMYKTGDIGRWLASGNIEYIGRKDGQVKIRGQRAELGEIQNTLLESGMADHAIVMVKGVESNKYLVAYIVPGNSFDEEAIYVHLRKNLPGFMVPSFIVALDSFPLTPNGKIDRNALLEMPDSHDTAEVFVAPGNQIQKDLAAIWQELLQVERIGITDNFFRLGGHSLLAMRLIAAVRKQWNADIGILDLFSRPTIEALWPLLECAASREAIPAILPANRNDRIPLSFSQERLWFIHTLNGSTQYHISWTLHLEGALDKEILEYAFGQLMLRHEILRTVIITEDDVPYAQLRLPEGWNMEYITKDGIISTGHNVQEYIKNFVGRPYNLSQDMPLRVLLVEVAAGRYLLTLAVHHIAFDWWSGTLLVKELAELYRSGIERRPPDLKTLTLQYADYAYWQRKYLSATQMDHKLGYWKKQLDGLEPLRLLTDHVRPAVQSIRGSRVQKHIGNELRGQLVMLSEKQGTTLFMTLLAAFKLLLHRYTGQEDICVGTPVAGRQQQELEGLIGFFANTLPLRTQVNAGAGFNELLEAVRQTTLEAYANQEAPFEKIVQACGAERALDRNPLFQVLFTMQAFMPADDAKLPGISVRGEDVPQDRVQFDISVEVADAGDGLYLTMSYCTDLYSPHTMERMMQHYENLLLKVIDDLSTPLSRLSLLGVEEEQQLLYEFVEECPPWPSHENIVTLFTQQSSRFPASIAVSYEGESITYAQLDARSNRVAHYLQQQGLPHEGRIAICMERSISMIVCILAVLKAGGAYVPIDPAYPCQRISYMLQDSGALQLLTSSGCMQNISIDCKLPVIQLDREWHLVQSMGECPLPVEILPGQLAYIIYTSGSTGTPKGVAIEHRNVVRLFQPGASAFDFNENDVWTLFHSYCFDFSVWEIFGALLYGGRLVIVPASLTKDMAGLAALLAKEEVTVLNQTPSAFYALQDEAGDLELPALRYVIFGGEALNPARLRTWKNSYPACRLINMYGITETTVHVTFQEIDGAYLESSSSIVGRPVPTLHAYVLDKFRQLVPIGVAGELYIGGEGLARKYLNLPELTSERFLADRFSKIAGARMYKSGDLARWLEDGTLEYLGRADSQVKVRGFRIETGEIETVLQQSCLVRNAFVQTIGQGGHTQLVAYIVPEGDFDRHHVVDFLSSRLPGYMLPSYIIPLEALPLTSNGKINKAALPLPGSPGLSKESFVAPQTLTAKILAGLWQELLGLQQVGIHDNFFDLGGDSIRVIRLVSRVRKAFSRDVKVIDVYRDGTIAGVEAILNARPLIVNSLHQHISQELDLLKGSLLPSMENREHIEDIFPISDIQSGMLYAAIANPGLAIYHDQFMYYPGKRIDIGLFETALSMLAARHPMLRTAFDLQAHSEGVQVVYKQISCKVHHHNLRHLDREDAREYIMANLRNSRKDSFVLNRAPLWKYVIFSLAEQDVITFDFHHAILDGWSVASLNTELNNTYLQLVAGHVLTPARPLQCTYRDFIIESLAHKRSDTNKAFWQEEMDGYKRLDIFTNERHEQRFVKEYSHATLSALKTRTKEDGLSLKTVLFGAYLHALRMLTHEDELTVGIVTNNRPMLEDGEKLIGCFLNSIPFRSRQDHANTWKAYFEFIGSKLRLLKERESSKLVEITSMTGESTRFENPFFDALFSFIDFHVYENMDAGLFENGNYRAFHDETTGTDSFLHESTNSYLNCLASTTGNVLSIYFISRKAFTSGIMLQELHQYFDQALNAYMKDYDGIIDRNSMLLPRDRQLLEQFNATSAFRPAGLTVTALFQQQASQHRHNPALVYNGCSFSSSELDEKANQLANYLLVQAGVRPGQAIAVKMKRSPDLIIALLAILKSGCAYVPLEPAIPLQRLEQVLADCGAAMMLTDAEAGISSGIPQLVIAQAREKIDACPGSSPQVHICPDNLCYIIYTSGSTGTPKGVQITHDNLVNYALWFGNTYNINRSDSTLLFSSIAFDLGYTALWPALLFGATLHLLEETPRLEPHKLTRYLVEERISFIKLTPSHFSMLTSDPDFKQNAGRYKLRLIVSGGEAMQHADVARLMEKRGDIVFVNHYGPAETTIGTIAGPLNMDAVRTGKKQLLGKPIHNNRIDILSKAGTLLPIGVPGEICVSGRGVGKGYIHNGSLTHERYIEHPLFPGSRMYRTGDIGRWLPSGEVEFLGREDMQVKIRGYRIELAEIEHALQSCPGVERAIVLAERANDDGLRILAYYKSALPLQEPLMLQWLKDRLPDYMLPSFLLHISDIPLTPNGKLNSAQLPKPSATENTSGPCTEPRNETEAVLLKIFRQILGVENIGIQDSFFDSGGHSLKAVRLLSQIHKELGCRVEVETIFENPTVERLAAIIGSGSQEYYESVPRIPEQETYELSHSQLRLWVLCKFEEATLAYNMLSACTLQKVDLQTFENAFRVIVERHEVLRTIFVVKEGIPRQQVLPYSPAAFVLEYIDVRQCGDIDQSIRQYMDQEMGTPFDLGKGPLIRAKLLETPNNRHVFLFTMHHIISDGWSKQVLAKEVITIYNDFMNGGASSLRPLKIQYRDYAAFQNKLLLAGNVQEHKQYWLDQFSEGVPVLDFPVDFQRPPVKTYSGSITGFHIDLSVAAALERIALEQGATLFMVLMAAVKTLMFRYTGQEDIVIGSPVAGRDHADLEEQIGFYVNTLALRTKFSGNDSFIQLLEKVKRTSLQAFRHQVYPFNKLVDDLDLERDMSRSPLFDVMVQLRNYQNGAYQTGHLELSKDQLLVKTTSSQFELSFDFEQQAQGLLASIEYNTAIFRTETIERLAQCLGTLVQSVARNPQQALHALTILPEAQTEQLLETFNAGHCPAVKGGTIIDMFHQQVLKNPSAVALVSGQHQLDFQALHDEAGKLAAFLHGRQLPPESIVGIMLDKSPLAVSSVLGVLKQGFTFLPVEPDYPFERIKFMLEDAGCGVLISEQRYIDLAHRLQWECASVRDLLVVDSPDGYEVPQMQAYKDSQQTFWDYVGQQASNDIGGGGWISSYTGFELGREEMDEYAENTFQKLLPYLHEHARVLEVGCSSGITMFRIAHLIGEYVGTDISAGILSNTAQQAEERNLHHISLHCLAAHELDKLDAGEFDIIIFNSVIQSFQGHNYLRDALKKSVSKLKPGGIIFCGDIQDLARKPLLVESLEAFSKENAGKGYLTKTNWSEELFLSADFFQDLPYEIPAITQASVSNKHGTIRNELSMFRFDVILETGVSNVNVHTRNKFQFGYEALQQLPANWKQPVITSQQAAYVIYTSGTTGLPKGVVVEHGSLFNIAHGWRTAYGLHQFPVRLLQMAGFSFDIFIADLCRSLLNGGCMVLCRKDMLSEPAALYSRMQEHAINIFDSTPAIVMPLMRYIFENKLDISFLEILVVGSDACPTEDFNYLVQHAAGKFRVLNGYGTTEATIDSAFFETDEQIYNANGHTPLGRPFAGNRLYILDKHRNLLPVGVTGELYIGGPVLSRGYLNRKELTDERFPADPFVPGRMYQTGDLCRWNAQGIVEFHGRKDQLIKVRGCRIEPAEIESRLLQLEGVEGVAVTACNNKGGEKILVAYYSGPAVQERSTLQEHLRKYLPENMVPAHFMWMEALPLNANGKIDRASLPEPSLDNASVEYAPPQNQLERKIAAIWEEVLDRKQIGRRENFFLLGGQSLKATRMISRIYRDMNISLELRSVFLNPTIESMAKAIASESTSFYKPIAPVPSAASYPLSHAQKRMWILSQHREEQSAYNISESFLLQGSIDLQAFSDTFSILLERHEILRTTFIMDGLEPVQRVHPASAFTCFRYQDLRASQDHAMEARASAALEAATGFDLEEGPLWRAMLLQLKEEEYVFTLSFHHIISDGWSNNIFMRELMAVYDACCRKMPLPLIPLRIQYKDFSRWQNGLLSGTAADVDRNFWLEQLSGPLPRIDFPLDFERAEVRTATAGREVYNFSSEMSASIRMLAEQNGSSLFMLMLSVLNTFVYSLTAQDDVIIGSVVAGREHPDLEDQLGLYINTLALRNKLSYQQSVSDLLQQIKRNTLEAHRHQLYPFDKLIEDLNLKRDYARAVLFDLGFTWQDAASPDRDILLPASMNVSSFDTGVQKVKADIWVHARAENGILSFSFTYSKNLFRQQSIQFMMEDIAFLAGAFVQAPGDTIATISARLNRQRAERAAGNQLRDRQNKLHRFVDRINRLHYS